MLNPRFYNAAGRRTATIGAAPTPALIVQGLPYTASGQLVLDSAAVAGSVRNGGIAFSATGAMYATTSTAGTDSFVSGLRVSATGQLVVVQANPTLISNGNPFDANGAICIG